MSTPGNEAEQNTSNEASKGNPISIDDDQLPEDLQPSEDNPLARSPKDEDEIPDDMLAGKDAVEMADDAQASDATTGNDDGEKSDSSS